MGFVPIPHTLHVLKCMLQEDPVEVDAASDEQNGNREDGRTGDEMKTTGTHLQTKTTQMIFRADLFQVKNRRHRRDRMIQRRKIIDESRRESAGTEVSKDVNKLQGPAGDLPDIDEKDDFGELDSDRNDERLEMRKAIYRVWDRADVKGEEDCFIEGAT
jgi:hypothetical protein